LQPAFFHNGAFTNLEDAMRFHVNALASARAYNPVTAGVTHDLQYRLGPIEPVLARLDPLLQNPRQLSPEEFETLVAFVKEGLLDPRARRQNLCQLVPASVPSGQPTLRFEGCPTPR
jgi:cytochrome c peroxidase